MRCRGGGIFLYRCAGAVIERCTVRNYHGDGISFQQCNDVTVLGCTSEGNAGLGLHPGSGSQRPTVRQCIENVGKSNNPSVRGNLLSRQLGRVASAIPPFMVIVRDLLRH